MKRFHKVSKCKGSISIIDILNTEPVCTIYAEYHPYAPDIIVEALNNYYGEIETDKCMCGNEKPKVFLHCGCESI